MFRKTLSRLLVLLLLGISLFNVEPVKAEEIIYIRSDGTVDPSTAPIQRAGNVYTFTDDIYDMSIEVQRDHVKLDGNGHMLQCSGEPKNVFGVYFYGREGVTVTNIVISDSYIYGILVDNSCNSKIISNTILGGVYVGIELQSSYHNTLTDNEVMNTYEAISLEDSSYNILSGNIVTENVWGIGLFFGTENTLRRNSMADNKYNFCVGYIWLESYLHDVDTTNTVDGKPIYYWINRHNKTVPRNAGCVVIVNSSGITVKNLKLENNAVAVELAYTRNSLIENVTGTGNWIGISLDISDHNIITRNTMTANEGPGIGLTLSDHNNLTDNIVLHSNMTGIWLEDTKYNTLIGNSVAYSRAGSPQEFDGGGILVDDSIHCNVIGNNVTRNKYGIVVGATPSTNNIVAENNITLNDIGFILFDARDNMIYHNNFIENQLQQVCTYYNTYSSSFDMGYPLGGNYWSDYTGGDLYSGCQQNETGMDGIGDIPYVIDGDHMDMYPAMGTFGPITLKGRNVTVFPTSDISLIFENVTREGFTTVDKTDVGPEPPSGFELTEQYCDIETTANYCGKLRNRFIYDDLTMTKEEEEASQLMQWNQTSQQWMNITSRVDRESNVIYGETSHLSLFGIFDPLINDVTVKRVTSSETIIVQGDSLQIDVTVANEGDFSENFNLTVYANTTIILTLANVSLTSGDSTTLELTWDTTASALGNYTISAYATPVSGETHINDNMRADGTIRIVPQIHNVAVTNVSASRSVIAQGYSLQVDVKVDNLGNVNEAFNVTLYSDTTTIETIEVTLTSENSMTITFMWNTTDWSKGTYTISAYATPVPDETDMADNNFTGGCIVVTILGDVDGDFDSDLYDIVAICTAYGYNRSHSEYVPECDLNCDGEINIYDVVIVCSHYGETYP